MPTLAISNGEEGKKRAMRKCGAKEFAPVMRALK